MTNRKKPPYPPVCFAPRAAVVLCAFFLFQAASQTPAQNQSPPAPPALPSSIAKFPYAWKTLVRNITPFSIDVAILTRSDPQAMTQIARLYIEFPDPKHIFQHTSFKEPIPFEYRSFSSDGLAIIHDMKRDSFLYVPSRIVPVSIFSLEKSAESFFETVRFEAIEPEILENLETYVLKISMAPLGISPGVKLEDIKGHLWINSKTGRPIKLVVTGKAGVMSEEKAQTSLLVDFHYGKMALDSEAWKNVDRAMAEFDNDRKESGVAAMRKIEKHITAKISAFQLPD